MKIDLSEPIDVVDLGHAMTDDMPNFPSAPAFTLVPNYRLGDFELPNGYWGCNEFLTMSGHSGTHLDALGHVAQDGRGFGGVSARDSQSGVRGLVKNAIDEVAPILRRGVLLDVASFMGVAVLEPGTAIGPDVLAAVAETAGVEIVPGDCVLVRTGWEAYWGEPERYIGHESGVPGVDLQAATMLGDAGVFLIGSDTGAVEVTRAGEFVLPVHMEALVQRGIHLLENLSLNALASRASAEFAFFCSPLKIRGSSGSPVRPIAVFQ